MKELLELFDSLVRTNGGLVWLADNQGAVLSISPDGVEQGLQDWLGRGWVEVIHPSDLAMVLAQFERASKHGETVEVSYRALRFGAYRWFRVRATPAPASDGSLHWVGIVEDIHDAVVAMEELRHSERVYRGLAEATAAVVWRSDSTGSATDIRGWSNLEGRTGFAWIEAIHPDDRERALAECRTQMAAGLPIVLQFRARTPCGEYRRCVSRAVPIKDESGTILEWVGTLTDVEDRLMATEALHRDDRLKSIGRLTAGVAHDFNNLLTVITGGAESLYDGLAAGDPLREQARLTLHAAERGAELVRELLAFSRQQPLQPRPVALGELFAAVEPLIRRLIGADVTLEIKRPAAELGCLADPAQLESALVNLVINARDAMPTGGRLSLDAQLTDVSTEAAPHMGISPGRYVVINVSDTGCGMPPEVLEHAVEPFYTTKPAGEGSGLGLSMVYGFAKQSAGHMTLSSSEQTGTHVRLLFPCAAVEQPAPAAPTTSVALAACLKVLLVEDDPLVREQVVRQLTSLGCEVCPAEAASDALQILSEGGAFDLLISDVILPGGTDGFELARQVQNLRPELPVLFTSGYTSDRIALRDHQAHSRFLQKPYRRAALAKAIQDVMAFAGGGAVLTADKDSPQPAVLAS